MSLPWRSAVLGILIGTQGIVMIRKGKFPPGKWVFPGGGIDEGEDVETAFYREMHEELGLTQDDYEKIEVTGRICEYDWYEQRTVERTGTRGQQQRIVVAHLKDGRQPDLRTATDEEVDEWCFLPPEELVENIAFEDKRKLAQELLDDGTLDQNT